MHRHDPRGLKARHIAAPGLPKILSSPPNGGKPANWNDPHQIFFSQNRGLSYVPLDILKLRMKEKARHTPGLRI
jgi:hypothetical protein